MDDEDLPIDIQISKLSDWLVSRRHVNKDWAQVVRKIRQKIKSAINDMPEHPEIVKLLSGTYINYYHCQKIVDILLETEKDSKNMFGWYTSQRMKDWQEITSMYSKNNVYMAEQGQQLIRYVVYEVPSLKKQIARCLETQEQCDKRQDDYLKTISMIKERYANSCKQMGIVGDNVEKELVAMARSMNKTFDKIAIDTKNLQEAFGLYDDFRSFTVPDSKIEVLPLLKLISERGDVTVYEWLHKEPPLTIEKPQQSADSTLETDDKIDFGEEQIDFGDDAIDFGDYDAQIDWGACETSDVPDEIDWENVDVPSIEKSEIVVESSGLEGGNATGEEALSVLSFTETRTQFIHELLELQGFLRQRKFELDSTETLLSMTQFTSAPKRVQQQNSNNIASFLITIQQIIDELSSTRMQHLYLISTSPRYVKRFAETLTAKLKELGGIDAKIAEIETKRKETTELHKKLTENLSVVIKKTLVLQNDVKKEISKKYNGRPVNLMGKVKG